MGKNNKELQELLSMYEKKCEEAWVEYNDSSNRDDKEEAYCLGGVVEGVKLSIETLEHINNVGSE